MNSLLPKILLGVTLWVGCGKGVGSGPDGGSAARTATWAKTVGPAPIASFFAGTASDSSGDVYAAGDLWGGGTLDLGNGVAVTGADGGREGVLVKYDTSGLALWEQTPGSDDLSSVAVDSAGDVYAAGSRSGAIVLAKYDSSGALKWTQTASSSPGLSHFFSLAVDSAGDVYAAGSIGDAGAYDFGNNVIATSTATPLGAFDPASNVVLVKYSSSGSAQWAQTVTAGSGASSFGAVAVDSADDVYAAGTIAGEQTYDFGNGVTALSHHIGGPIAGQEAGSVVLVKYSSAGLAQWAQTAVGGASSWAAVATDSSGDVYAAGAIGEGTHDFGNAVTAAGTCEATCGPSLAGPQYLVLVKYSSSGVALWAQTVKSGGPNSNLNALTIDSSGNVFAVGALYGVGKYDFGNGVTAAVNAASTNYAVLIDFSSSGVAQWADSSSGSGDTTFASVAVDAKGNLYAAGGIAGSVDFGNGVTGAGANPGVGDGWSALLVRY